MDDIYKINKFNLNLGNTKTLNSKTLVSKSRIDQACKAEQELCVNTKKGWSKMRKAQKLKKIKQFSQSYVNREEFKGLSDDEKQSISKICWEFLRDAVDKKRINNKDVDYDEENDVIVNIKSLVYKEQLKRFALKRGNNGSSISNLPNLRLRNK
jgi:hypothetical protein